MTRRIEHEATAMSRSVVSRPASDAKAEFVGTWAGRIRPHLQQAVSAIVAAGRELAEARAVAPHGGWTPLCDELGLHPRTAQQFMQIAANPALADANHGSHLPPTWTVLRELARMEPGQLVEAIEDGHVTPELGRGQARALVARGYRRQAQPVAPTYRSSGYSGTCIGCGICAGCTCHYLPRKPRAVDMPHAVRVINVDGHGVVYDEYRHVDNAPMASSSEPWQIEQLTNGEQAQVLRRPRSHCGATGCRLCATIGA